MANKKEVIMVLTYLQALYPSFQLNKATIEAYYSVLYDIPYELLDVATQDIGSRSVFFPAVAKLRAIAFELLEEKSGLPSAYAAWGEVLDLTSRFSPSMAPKFSHPLIDKALDDLGGDYYVRYSENLVSERARFIEAYNEHLGQFRRTVRKLPTVREAQERLNISPGKLWTMKQVEESLSRQEGGNKNLLDEGQ